MRSHRRIVGRSLLSSTALAGALFLSAGALRADPPAAQLPAAPSASASASAMPSAAPSQSALRPPPLTIDRYTLPNGLEVILHEDHRTPTVAVNIWYHVGSKDEPMGRNGFAHLFEHLMFQGSLHVAEDTFFLNLERIGATGINGTTGDDRTNYFETVPSGRLNLALWLESDRMAFLLDHVNQETFESQRSVVLNERRQSYENAPYGNVYRVLREAMFPREHPYYRLPIGTPEDLNAATLVDVQRFFNTWYVPNNATLVIAGDFRPADARAMVERYFAPIPRGPDVPRRAAPAPVRLERETRIEMEAGVELPRVYLSWSTPPFFAAGDGELDLIGNLLTEGRSSRLYRKLVHELQIAQDVSAGQDSSQLGSTFDIIATARPGHTAQELVTAIDAELARLREEPPSSAEVERARATVLSHLFFDIERVGSRANRINTYNQYTGNADYLQRDVERYATPLASDLQRVIREQLPPDRRVVVSVTPVASAPISGRIRGEATVSPAGPPAGGPAANTQSPARGAQ